MHRFREEVHNDVELEFDAIAEKNCIRQLNGVTAHGRTERNGCSASIISFCSPICGATLYAATTYVPNTNQPNIVIFWNCISLHSDDQYIWRAGVKT